MTLNEPAFQSAVAGHLMGAREIDGDAEIIFREFVGWYLEEVESGNKCHARRIPHRRTGIWTGERARRPE